VILAIGSRLSDFTTASRSLFRNPAATLIQLNVAPYDAAKHGALPLVADARAGLEALGEALAGWTASPGWTAKARNLSADWNAAVAQATAPSNAVLPSDAQVLGAVNRTASMPTFRMPARRDLSACADVKAHVRPDAALRATFHDPRPLTSAASRRPIAADPLARGTPRFRPRRIRPICPCRCNPSATPSR
jgi:thiamine pyrophosphate-dependent acetolactate synthase large subunit-like protein